MVNILPLVMIPQWLTSKHERTQASQIRICTISCLWTTKSLCLRCSNSLQTPEGGFIFLQWETEHSSVAVAHQYDPWPTLLPLFSINPLHLSPHFPPSCQQHRHSSLEWPLFSYICQTLSQCDFMTPLLPLCPCACFYQTGRLPHWPCCWGALPSPWSPSSWRWSPCASDPGVAATSLWLSCCSLQVRK